MHFVSHILMFALIAPYAGAVMLLAYVNSGRSLLELVAGALVGGFWGVLFCLVWLLPLALVNFLLCYWLLRSSRRYRTVCIGVGSLSGVAFAALPGFGINELFPMLPTLIVGATVGGLAGWLVAADWRLEKQRVNFLDMA